MKEDLIRNRAKAMAYVHSIETGRDMERKHLIELVDKYLELYRDAKLDEFSWLVAGDKAGEA